MPPAPPTLFTPFGSLGLRNRSVMAPMTRYACTSDGNPTNEVKAYYRRRAENELSLIIVESSAVNDGDGMGYLNGARFHTAEHVREWKKVVDDVHAAGAKIWIQLFHPGRLTVEAITGGKVLAPSATPAFDGPSFWRPEVDGKTVSFQTQTPFETPVAMSLAEIETVTSQFAHSCRLAVEAGFDGVEIHGAHGYLLHQFCHSEVNERTDAFSPSAQFAFIGQVVQACREALGPEPTLSYRLSVHMVDNTFIRYDPEAFDHTQLVRLLDAWGVDVFHSSELKIGAKIFDGDVSLHELIRGQTGKPIIACGAMQSREAANAILAEGIVDLIAFGRLLIPNPFAIRDFRKENEAVLVKFDYKKHIAILH